jgi:hypothetical protein
MNLTGVVQWLRLALSKGPNWVGVFPLTPEDGNRSSFRYVVLISFWNTGRWRKSKNPVILRVCKGFGKGVHWIRLAQDRGKWQALVNAMLNMRVPWSAGKRSISGKFDGKWNRETRVPFQRHSVVTSYFYFPLCWVRNTSSRRRRPCISDQTREFETVGSRRMLWERACWRPHVRVLGV